MGEWAQACEAIEASLVPLTNKETETRATASQLAQALDIQARLQLSRGHTKQALITWDYSAALIGTWEIKTS